MKHPDWVPWAIPTEYAQPDWDLLDHTGQLFHRALSLCKSISKITYRILKSAGFCNRYSPTHPGGGEHTPSKVARSGHPGAPHFSECRHVSSVAPQPVRYTSVERHITTHHHCTFSVYLPWLEWGEGSILGATGEAYWLNFVRRNTNRPSELGYFMARWASGFSLADSYSPVVQLRVGK